MLGFTLNEEQEAFRARRARASRRRRSAPRVEELEATETFPMDLFRELGPARLPRRRLSRGVRRQRRRHGDALPPHRGDRARELRLRGGAARPRRARLHPAPALRHRGAEARATWCRRCAARSSARSGLSEPNAGSDAASIRTTAERRGDDYVINGSKMFITNGNIADYCLVAAYTDRSKRGTGISMFVVDTEDARASPCRGSSRRPATTPPRRRRSPSRTCACRRRRSSAASRAASSR